MSKRRWIVGVPGAAAVVVLALGFIGTAAASGANPLKPTVSSFVATPASLSGFSGGVVSLSANVTNATSCTFTSNRPVTGLPVTVPCSNGTIDQSATVPVNPGPKVLLYRFTLSVTWMSGVVKAKAGLTVSSGYHILQGSQWTLTVSPEFGSPSCSVQTFVSRHKWVDDFGGSGTFTGGGLTVQEPAVWRIPPFMGATWNSTANEYQGAVSFSGTGSGFIGNGVTLSPGATPGC